MTKFKGKDYDQLSEASKKRLSTALEKVHKSGFSIKDYEQMNDKDFSKNLGIKLGKKTKYGYSNVYAHRKLFKQVKGTPTRKTESIEKSLKKYEKEGWKGKGLVRMKKELVKVAGNTFQEVYEQLDKKYHFESKSTGYEYTRQLLMIPKSQIENLNDYDQDVIEGYDTSP